MIGTIKAEFRKLLSVRSTYVILAFALAIEIFFALYATGFKADAASLKNPHMLGEEVTNAISFLATFVALAPILLVTHEYRYNTILYTLTSAKSRSRVLLAKFLAVSIFALAFSLVIGFLSPVLANLGVHLAGHNLVHQTIPVADLLWRTLFVGWGYAMMGLVLSLIIRAQTGVIAALFLVPTTAEPLLGLLLKTNQVYLPFSSISAVITHVSISYVHAAMVATAYIVGGLVVAWVLFLRRDAAS